ncbi:MAG: hypothetical protein K0S75_2917 [Clostridia bacterium]|nr:hypothetical protein [Clostridia bacterium]
MAAETISKITKYLVCAHAMTANFGPKGISVSKIEDYVYLKV